MPPTVEDRLRDILEAIAEVDELLQGTTLERFAADRLLRLATERLLEIVCEASRHLSDDIKIDAPYIHWRKMIDFGNLLRHAYHETDVGIVWSIIQSELPALKNFVDSKLLSLR
jgi:uncharacterized protein with HEPN domain